MPPLVMPWLSRKPSSVCTNTSKIALPIPRTSYFASVIHQSCCGNCEGVRPITIDPKGRCLSVESAYQHGSLPLSRLRGSIGRHRRPSLSKNAEAQLRLWHEVRRVG